MLCLGYRVKMGFGLVVLIGSWATPMVHAMIDFRYKKESCFRFWWLYSNLYFSSATMAIVLTENFTAIRRGLACLATVRHPFLSQGELRFRIMEGLETTLSS